MQQHGSKYFARRPPPPTTLGVGWKVKIQLFQNTGHVSYKIKGNHECKYMVANILPADPNRPPHPSPTRWVGS